MWVWVPPPPPRCKVCRGYVTSTPYLISIHGIEHIECGPPQPKCEPYTVTRRLVADYRFPVSDAQPKATG